MCLSRRLVLHLSVSGLGLSIAGCAEVTSSPTESPTPPPTHSPTPSYHDLLPTAPEGWERMLLGDPSGIGDLADEIDGLTATYRMPDGVEYWVILLELKSPEAARRVGPKFKRVNWQVVVPYEQYIFAASSGTTTETKTPGHAPQLGQTPVPGEEETALVLLSHSPVLTERYVRQHQFEGETEPTSYN